jgi:hypothetical protein
VRVTEQVPVQAGEQAPVLVVVQEPVLAGERGQGRVLVLVLEGLRIESACFCSRQCLCSAQHSRRQSWLLRLSSFPN